MAQDTLIMLKNIVWIFFWAKVHNIKMKLSKSNPKFGTHLLHTIHYTTTTILFKIDLIPPNFDGLLISYYLILWPWIGHLKKMHWKINCHLTYLLTIDIVFFGDAKLDIFSFLRNLSFYASVFIDQKNVK